MNGPCDLAPEEGIDPQPGIRDEAIGGLLSILAIVLLVYGVAFAFQHFSHAGLA